MNRRTARQIPRESYHPAFQQGRVGVRVRVRVRVRAGDTIGGKLGKR